MQHRALPHVEQQPISVLEGAMAAAATDSGKDYADPFSLFNQISSRLMGSYQQLEQRVDELSSELDCVSEQRLNELTAKEKLANKLTTLIDSLPGGVVVLDSTGCITDSNPAAESMLESDLNSKIWRDVVSRCFTPRADDGHEVSNQKGQRISIVTRSLNDDGQIILLTDLTQTRRLQADVSRNQRLSALGKMVSTLAHQVRTPLSSAMLYANHLCDKNLGDGQHDKFAQKLKGRLEFMERQVRDMLLFVKGDVPMTDDIDVTTFKQSLVDAVDGPLAMNNSICIWEMDDCDAQIRCNLDALTGAVLNLVQNSIQASKKLELIIQCHIYQNKLTINIIDNGPGIQKHSLQEAQELFYTTKGQGTGIGLSVVNHVARSHGGEFVLSNRQDIDGCNGLCASLRLPIIK